MDQLRAKPHWLRSQLIYPRRRGRQDAPLRPQLLPAIPVRGLALREPREESKKNDGHSASLWPYDPETHEARDRVSYWMYQGSDWDHGTKNIIVSLWKIPTLKYELKKDGHGGSTT